MASGAPEILTEATVLALVRKHAADIGVFQKDEALTAKRILGGNINFAFRVASDSDPGSKALFVKQAPGFVAVFGPDGYPLTSERMHLEMDLYEEWSSALGPELAKKYLPTVYKFDPHPMAVAMEFLDGYELLDHFMVKPEGTALGESITAQLGDLLGRTHSATHASRVSTERRDYLAEHFENRPMRDIQLEFVFTKCFKEATDEQRAGLELTPEFMGEIDLLRQQYVGRLQPENYVLCHGDLHPGSIMINHGAGSVKVIDPEFTVYGPPGLDMGSLLSGFVLAAIHQAYSKSGEAAAALCGAAGHVWGSYREAMLRGGVGEAMLRATEVEAAGFALMEVFRTALGFAGDRKWLQFEDPATRTSSRKAALELVGKCMVARHGGGVTLLLDELRRTSTM